MEFEPKGVVTEVAEKENRPPFVIRAHHLRIFRKLLKSGESVEDFKDTYFNKVQKERASRFKIPIYMCYLTDILGSTSEQADRFRLNEREFLREFLQLSSDYPVKIVKGQKDKICQGCAIGEHCSKKGSFSLLKLNLDYRDNKYMRGFRNAAGKLNLQHDLTVVEETVKDPNAKPETVESILTTVGIVKKVLRV